jgi:hypothetical protein
MSEESIKKREQGKLLLNKFSKNASNNENERNLTKAIPLFQESINESKHDMSNAYESSKLLLETFEKLSSLIEKDQIYKGNNFNNFIWYNNMMMKLLKDNLSFSQQSKDGNEESFINKSKTIIENLPLENIGNNAYNMIENFKQFPNLYFELIVILMKNYIKEGLKLYNSDKLSLAKNTFYSVSDIRDHYELSQNLEKLEINPSIKRDINEVIGEAELYYRKINARFDIQKGIDTFEQINADDDEYDKQADGTVSITHFRNALKEIQKIEKKNNELEVICLSYISVIMWKIFQYTNKMDKVKEYVDQVIKYGKDNKKESENWYKKAVEVSEDIIKRKEMRDDFEKNDEEKVLKLLQEKAEKSHLEFIKYILEKYPYKGYKKNEDIESKFNKNKLSFIRSLVVKYHPDRYPKVTEEEKKKFVIIHEISAILNNIYVYYDQESES